MSTPPPEGTPHRAGCVAIGGRGLLIEGPPGSGKSSLALALIDRGAVLVGDDGVLLRAEGGRLLAGPPPAIDGLIEIRNVGIVRMEPARDVPVALAIRLDPDAPRYLETAEETRLLGIALPLVRLWPDTPALALRAHWALKIHGRG